MWTYQHAIESAAPADAIFALFAQVDSWPLWNAGVERVELDGPFVAGTRGTMFMPGQEPIRFRLVWVEPGRGFEDETELPDMNVVVRVRHTLDALPNGGTRIAYSATIDGPAADEVGPAIGPAITGDFPAVMQALATRVEEAAAGR